MAASCSTTSLEALKLEISQAFSSQKKKVFKSRATPPELEWLLAQCSSEELFQLYTGDRSDLTLFDMQTYKQWKSHIEYERVKNFRRLRQKTIIIQPLVLSLDAQVKSGYVDTEIHQPVLKYLRHYCEAFFTGMSVDVAPPIDVSTIKHVTSRVHSTTNREQYLVGDLLKFLKSICPKHAFSIVGVTMVDIYPGPEWNFVLGQASITTGCGVFSFGRYFSTRTELDKVMAENSQVKELWILLRVMTHELCHIFGIKHCYYFQCSLNESSSINEAAGQPLFACPICLKKLRKTLQFNILERYKGLLEATKEMQKAVCTALQVCALSERCLTPVLSNHSHSSAGMEIADSPTRALLILNTADRNAPSSSSPDYHHCEEDGCKSDTRVAGVQSTDEKLRVRLVKVTKFDLPKELRHSEQLEYFRKAIKWLEEAIDNLEWFESQLEKK